MAKRDHDIKMGPLEGKIDETVEDQEPSNIPEFQETSFELEGIPSEVIGQDREHMWNEASSRKNYVQLINISKRPGENFRVDRRASHGRFIIEGEELAFETFG